MKTTTRTSDSRPWVRTRKRRRRRRRDSVRGQKKTTTTRSVRIRMSFLLRTSRALLACQVSESGKDRQGEEERDIRMAVFDDVTLFFSFLQRQTWRTQLWSVESITGKSASPNPSMGMPMSTSWARQYNSLKANFSRSDTMQFAARQARGHTRAGLADIAALSNSSRRHLATLPDRRPEGLYSRLQQKLSAKHKSIGIYVIAVAVGMVGLTYASVPIYRIFCAATGFGGTVQRVEVIGSAE